MSDLHEPWCDTQLGPDFEVEPGVVRMTIFACMGCKGEMPPAAQSPTPPTTDQRGANDE